MNSPYSTFSCNSPISDDELLKRRIDELTRENVRLRNESQSMAEELFDLKANLIVSEAEIKFESKKEVDALRSELSFKNQEFHSLSQKYQLMCKNLSSQSFKREKPPFSELSTPIAVIKADQAISCSLLSSNSTALISQDFDISSNKLKYLEYLHSFSSLFETLAAENIIKMSEKDSMDFKSLLANVFKCFNALPNKILGFDYFVRFAIALGSLVERFALLVHSSDNLWISHGERHRFQVITALNHLADGVEHFSSTHGILASILERNEISKKETDYQNILSSVFQLPNDFQFSLLKSSYPFSNSRCNTCLEKIDSSLEQISAKLCELCLLILHTVPFDIKTLRIRIVMVTSQCFVNSYRVSDLSHSLDWYASFNGFLVASNASNTSHSSSVSSKLVSGGGIPHLLLSLIDSEGHIRSLSNFRQLIAILRHSFGVNNLYRYAVTTAEISSPDSYDKSINFLNQFFRKLLIVVKRSLVMLDQLDNDNADDSSVVSGNSNRNENERFPMNTFLGTLSLVKESLDVIRELLDVNQIDVSLRLILRKPVLFPGVHESGGEKKSPEASKISFRYCQASWDSEFLWEAIQLIYQTVHRFEKSLFSNPNVSNDNTDVLIHVDQQKRMIEDKFFEILDRMVYILSVIVYCVNPSEISYFSQGIHVLVAAIMYLMPVVASFQASKIRFRESFERLYALLSGK